MKHEYRSILHEVIWKLWGLHHRPRVIAFVGMNVNQNYRCIIVKMQMEDFSRDYLSFELLKHHAYSHGYSWYWQDHTYLWTTPSPNSPTSNAFIKDTNDFYKVYCKGTSNGLLPTCPCNTRDSTSVFMKWYISTRRQEAPAKVWVAVDTFRSTCTFSTFRGLRAVHGGGNPWQPMLERITLGSNYETNCLNQFWIQSIYYVQYNSLKLSITGDPKSKRRLLFTSQRCPQPESRQHLLRWSCSFELHCLGQAGLFQANSTNLLNLLSLAEVTNPTNITWKISFDKNNWADFHMKKRVNASHPKSSSTVFHAPKHRLGSRTLVQPPAWQQVRDPGGAKSFTYLVSLWYLFVLPWNRYSIV